MDEKKTRILIYGIGWFTRRYYETTRQLIKYAPIEHVGFVDKRAREYPNGYQGIRTYLPDDITNLQFDNIYIFVCDDKNLFASIKHELMENQGIHENKIGSILDLIQLVQEYHRLHIKIERTRTPRIYDCFQFYNEVEIAQIRMEMMAPYVDYFVIVEMNKDHRGKEKPYNFLTHKKEFEPYQKKIIYVQPSDIPDYDPEEQNEYGHVWTLEHYQRECIEDGLTDAEPNDVIMISDCDEIPNPKIVAEIRENLLNKYKTVLNAYLENGTVALRQDYFYYYFNCHLRRRANTTTIVKYKNMMDPQIIRDFMDYFPFIDHGGWHLTYFGGVDRIRQKIGAIVEGTEVSDADIMKRITSAEDVYGREGSDFEMEFLNKKDIPIPDIDYWIAKYPEFYLDRDSIRGGRI